MNKPTLGEYKIALDKIKCCKQSLNLVLEKKNKLLDELLKLEFEPLFVED